MDFAVLFGSLTYGKPHSHSDLDLEIATTRKVSLPEIGFLVAWLEEITGKRVDLVLANYLPLRNPVLAFEVARGELLFARDQARFVAFKKAFFVFWIPSFYER